jgi:hypothetical protein
MAAAARHAASPRFWVCDVCTGAACHGAPCAQDPEGGADAAEQLRIDTPRPRGPVSHPAGRRNGERRRKSVRGCIVSPDLSVLNLVGAWRLALAAGGSCLHGALLCLCGRAGRVGHWQGLGRGLRA